MNELELMTEKQAAKALGLKPHTLTVWRCRKPEKAVPYVKVGRAVLYRKADIIEWLASRVVRHGGT